MSVPVPTSTQDLVEPAPMLARAAQQRAAEGLAGLYDGASPSGGARVSDAVTTCGCLTLSIGRKAEERVPVPRC